MFLAPRTSAPVWFRTPVHLRSSYCKSSRTRMEDTKRHTVCCIFTIIWVLICSADMMRRRVDLFCVRQRSSVSNRTRVLRTRVRVALTSTGTAAWFAAPPTASLGSDTMVRFPFPIFHAHRALFWTKLPASTPGTCTHAM